jgi:hypothetical protein
VNNLYSGSSISGAHAVLHSPNALEVAGVHSCTAHVVKWPVPKDNHEALNSVGEWAPEDLLSAVYPTGESALAAFALALSLGWSGNDFLRQGIYCQRFQN